MFITASIEDRRRLVVSELRFVGEMIGVDREAVAEAIDNHAIHEIAGDREQLEDVVLRQLRLK